MKITKLILILPRLYKLFHQFICKPLSSMGAPDFCLKSTHVSCMLGNSLFAFHLVFSRTLDCTRSKKEKLTCFCCVDNIMDGSRAGDSNKRISAGRFLLFRRKWCTVHFWCVRFYSCVCVLHCISCVQRNQLLEFGWKSQENDIIMNKPYDPFM